MQLLTGQEAANWDRQFQKKQPQPVSSQPKQDNGLVGFLQNAGKSVGSDFTRIGQGTANVINDFTGGAQRESEQQSRKNQEDVKLIRDYGQKIRSAKNPQEKQRYQNALGSLMKTSDKSDEEFRKHQADIIEQNDPLKGAAAIGGIGLDVLGGGAGGSILKGGLLKAIGRATGQGALFGGAQGALEPVKEKGGQANLEDILGNATSGAGLGALTGGALGVAGGIGSKILGRLAKKPVQGINEATTNAGSPSILNRVGKRLTEGGSGIKAEPTVGGVKKLDQQSEFMSKYTGTPRQQRVAMEKDMGDLSNQVDDILSKNPTPIKGSEVRTKVQQAISDPLKYADVDLNLPGVQKNLDSHLTKFGSAKSAKELNDYIKLLNPIAKKAQDKIARGAAVTDKEAAALTAKRAGDEVLSSIPEIKPLKQNMAQIFDVTPQVAKAGEKGIGVPMVSGISSKAPVQAFKGAQSKIGSMLQKGSRGKVDQKALATAFKQPDVAGQLTSPDMSRNGAIQGAFGGLVNPIISRNAATAQPETQQPVESLQEQPSITPPSTDQTGASIFNKDSIQSLILQDLSSNGGKNVSTLLALYKAFGEDQAQKPLSSTAATAIGNANSGLNSLQQLEDIISQQGGVSKGTLVPGRDLFGGLGANALGTASYDTAAKNIQDVITRLRSGAAITPDEAAFYNSQLPSAFDSPDVISQKTQMFKDLFNSVADRTGGNTVDVQSLTTQ